MNLHILLTWIKQGHHYDDHHDNDKTYEVTNSKDVWCKPGQSVLDKRQCTVQLTIFADDIPRIRPSLIFHVQELFIKNSEKKQWDKRVTIQFQKNAWCDEGFKVTWIQNDWGSYFSNPPTPVSTDKLLIADIH